MSDLHGLNPRVVINPHAPQPPEPEAPRGVDTPYTIPTIRSSQLHAAEDHDLLNAVADAIEQRVSSKADAYRGDPVLWAKDRTGADLWSKQREIILSVRDNHETAVPSCHTVGKSFTAAMVAAWWIDSHPVGDAFVVTTAPTGAQVKAILWREINRAHAAAGLAGRTNLTEWYIGNELVAIGRKPSEYAGTTAFQGIHALHVLVIIDEACGVPEVLWDALSTLTSNDLSRTLAIGNPDDPHSKFARVCKPDSGWKVIQIGAQATPNWTGEEVSDKVRSLLISKRWAEQKKKEWGETSALYVAKIMGLFPDDAEWGVIPWSFLGPCRYLDHPEGEPVEAGLDFGASTGGDRTVLSIRKGTRLVHVWQDHTPDAMKAVGMVVPILNQFGVTKLKTDSTGAGWGPTDRLRELSKKHNPTSAETTHNAEVVPVNFGAGATDPKKFLNARAELWWNGRELSRLQDWDLGELDDDALAELTAPRYEIMDSKGRLKVEPKSEVKKRLGRSPDIADSVLLAYFDAGTSIAYVSSAAGMNQRRMNVSYASASTLRR